MPSYKHIAPPEQRPGVTDRLFVQSVLIKFHRYQFRLTLTKAQRSPENYHPSHENFFAQR
jgi:hypothetical protein